MLDLLPRSSTHIARIAGRRRRFALGLAAFGGAALLALAAAVGSLRGASSAPTPRTPARSGLASIPLAAQGQISAALGREQSGYRLVGLRARNRAQRFGAVFSREGASIDSGSLDVADTVVIRPDPAPQILVS